MGVSPWWDRTCRPCGGPRGTAGRGCRPLPAGGACPRAGRRDSCPAAGGWRPRRLGPSAAAQTGRKVSDGDDGDDDGRNSKDCCSSATMCSDWRPEPTKRRRPSELGMTETTTWWVKRPNQGDGETVERLAARTASVATARSLRGRCPASAVVRVTNPLTRRWLARRPVGADGLPPAG